MGNRLVTEASWEDEARSRAVPFLGTVQAVLRLTEHWKVEHRGIPGYIRPDVPAGDADCSGQEEAK